MWHPSRARWEELGEQLERVGPRTIPWLNETQRYFLPASGGECERLAEDLLRQIGDTDRGPVLILGALWHSHYNALAADPGSVIRKLFGPAVIAVPPKFTGSDLEAMHAAAAGDGRLELACARAEGGQITQYLAGARNSPLLRHRP